MSAVGSRVWFTSARLAPLRAAAGEDPLLARPYSNIRGSDLRCICGIAFFTALLVPVPMSLVLVLFAFVAQVLVSALALYAAGRFVADEGTYLRAVATVLVVIVVQAFVDTFFGWIPLLGPLATLVTYLAVIRVAYGVGWLKAVGITLVAWLVLFAISLLFAPLALLGI